MVSFLILKRDNGILHPHFMGLFTWHVSRLKQFSFIGHFEVRKEDLGRDKVTTEKGEGTDGGSATDRGSLHKLSAGSFACEDCAILWQFFF